jgi:hypothetical protein
MAIEKERIFRDGVLIEEREHEVSDPIPRVLSATGFMDHVAAAFVSLGLTQAAAEARFQEIMEAARDFTAAGGVTAETAKRVRLAHERYTKAGTYEKSKVDQLCALFVAAGVGSMTAGERNAITDKWPPA